MKHRTQFLLAGIALAALGYGLTEVKSQAECGSVLQCSQRAVEAAEKAVPAGAVIAFDLEQCPDGWAPYNNAKGRAIIGVVPKGQETNEVSVRELRSSGGIERTILTADHIPEHRHATQAGVLTGNDTWGNAGTGYVVAGVTMVQALRSNTSPFGAAIPRPVETMPPFVALLYCVRK